MNIDKILDKISEKIFMNLEHAPYLKKQFLISLGDFDELDSLIAQGYLTRATEDKYVPGTNFLKKLYDGANEAFDNKNYSKAERNIKICLFFDPYNEKYARTFLKINALMSKMVPGINPLITLINSESMETQTHARLYLMLARVPYFKDPRFLKYPIKFSRAELLTDAEKDWPAYNSLVDKILDGNYSAAFHLSMSLLSKSPSSHLMILTGMLDFIKANQRTETKKTLSALVLKQYSNVLESLETNRKNYNLSIQERYRLQMLYMLNMLQCVGNLPPCLKIPTSYNRTAIDENDFKGALRIIVKSYQNSHIPCDDQCLIILIKTLVSRAESMKSRELKSDATFDPKDRFIYKTIYRVYTNGVALLKSKDEKESELENTLLDTLSALTNIEVKEWALEGKRYILLKHVTKYGENAMNGYIEEGKKHLEKGEYKESLVSFRRALLNPKAPTELYDYLENVYRYLNKEKLADEYARIFALKNNLEPKFGNI